jgi:hypothetical protein
MGDYGGTFAEASARIPGSRDLTADTKPTSADATDWILEAEAKINNVLRFIGVGVVPLTSADLVAELKAWSLDYAEGRVRRAYAAAGGAPGFDDGNDLLEAFNAWIAAIRSDPQDALLYFSGGSLGSDDAAVRSTSTANVNAPTFEMSRGGSQF